VTARSTALDQCCAALNVEPFRVQPIRETSCVSLVRFDHPSGIPLPTSYSSHDAAKNFRVNIVERGWFRLKYGRREWTLGAGSMFLSRPTEVYSYSHVKYEEPDTCLRVEFSGPVADDLRRSVFRLPLVLPTTNRLSFLRLRISSLLANAAEMSLDVLACEVVDAAANAEHDRHRLYRSEQLRWYAERVGAARELMDCDPTTNRPLWHLSSQVGMSVFLFARVFREQTRTMSPELRQKRANATNRRRSSMSAPARCPCAQTQSIPGSE